MKIQNLAIIFIIIILPISLVLSSYMQGRVTTLKNQLNYDTKLYNATYDAVKAFQINTLNSDTSNQANSKMRDLQAAVNSFFNSMQTNFSMNGYSKDILQTHVPALVFTLYDGYYIYSPFNNTLDQETKDKLKTGTAKEGYTYDLKPYVYYSCRYKKAGSYDVVITYSLDSYITIQGEVGSEHWDEKGYLLSGVSKNGDNISYRGVQIDTETGLKENVIIDGQVQNLEYRKVNGVKYYLKGDKVYTVTNGKAELQTERNASFVRENTNAKDYYTQAYELKEKIWGSNLRRLTASDAVDENGNSITIQPGGQSSSVKNDTSFNNYSVFGELENSDDKVQIEDKNSDFNAHKMQVIKRSVIRNLSMAISDFNGYSGTTDVFKMPRLSDEDWDKLTENIGMISFLQGLNVGGKEYNGYSIITNNKNKEFVSEDSIYIEQGTTYHKATDTDLTSKNGLVGYFNVDYERRTGELTQGTSQVTGYYNPRIALGCYQSIVRQENVATGELKDWLNQTDNINLKKAYYTALGRERCSTYRVQSSNAIVNSSDGSQETPIEPQEPVKYNININVSTNENEVLVERTMQVDEGKVLTYDQLASNVPTGYKLVTMRMRGQYTGENIVLQPGQSYVINENKDLYLIVESNVCSVLVTMVDADDTSTIIKSNNLEVEKGQSITYEQIASDVPTGYNISYMWFQNRNTGRVTYIESGGSYTINDDTDLCVGINRNYYTVYVDMHTYESHKGGGTINVEKGGTITYSQIASDVPSGYKIVSMKMQGENSGNEVTMRPGRTYSINEDQTIDLIIEENYYNVYVDIHTSESIVPGGGNIQIEKGKSITYEEVAACVPSGYTIRTMTMQGEDSGETVRMRAGRSYVVNEDQSIDLLVVKN